jgi:hypothetical protein
MNEQQLAGVVTALAGLNQNVDAATRIDRIRLLENLKSATAAAQARETAAFVASQRAGQAAAGLPKSQVGRGVAAQIGLARRVSPCQAQRYAGWATILTTELPATFAALAAGQTTEWRALLVARETVFLSREHRAVVDCALGPRLGSLGDKRTEAEARKIGYRLDPAGFVARARAAANDRHVSLRPAPDAMARLTALLPVAQGVASYAALTRAADTTTAVGDERGRGQIMADTLVERVTGQAVAGNVPITVNLVMTDQTLLNGDTEPAHVDNYGPIPAQVARALVTSPDGRTPMWMRRLYTSHSAGRLVAMESEQRRFTAGQPRFIRLHDQWCRTPYCEAPIRHTDHVIPREHGGPTATTNAQGKCEACNYAKQAPGWQDTVVAAEDGRIEIETRSPTGHRYRSRAPDPPGDPRKRGSATIAA